MQPTVRNSISRWLRRTAPAALLAAAVVLPLSAQQPQGAAAAPPRALTPEIRREVVDSLAARVARFYAVAEDGQKIAEHLQRRQREGAYDEITNLTLLAEALSTDLKAINQDRHLNVVLHGPGPKPLPMGMEALPKPNGGTSSASSSPQMLAMARRNNFEIGRVEVLPGNVGYLEMRGFPPVAEAAGAIVTALRLLEHTDAVILDVRDHKGGSGSLSNFLISHFTGSEPLHTLDKTIRAANHTEKMYTLAEVPGPRRPEVPVYVLTSRGTISAGEDLAFVLKNLGRATLVGETTMGAGRNNPSFDIGHGFTASISISTVKDPRSGAEWEGVGVTPHLAVPPRAALAVAHAHALQRLAEGAASPVLRRELELTREFVEARERPHEVAPATLQRYVGVYGGERTITVENGRLIYRRLPYALGQELLPLSDTLFALGAWRLAFEPGAGEGMRLRSTGPNGQSLVFDRTGPPPAIPSEYR